MPRDPDQKPTGRPRKSAEEKRGHRHEFWLNDEEHAAFMSKAKFLGLRPGALVRHYIETGHARIVAVPPANRAALADLARLGNGIVGHLKGSPQDVPLLELLRSTLEQVKALRNEMAGK